MTTPNTSNTNKPNATSGENAPRTVPDSARTVLVPIANPQTAPDLLHLAAALAHPEEGRIIPLIVTLGDVEKSAEAYEELEAICDEVMTEGIDLEIQQTVSTSVARGVLDTAREIGADLIILGLNKNRARGQSSLGTVVENVLETAPCDVLVYRPGQQSDFKRIMIPVRNTFQAQVAARMGIRLARHYQTHVEAIYAQSSNRHPYEGYAYIEEAIAGVPGRESVKRTVITAQDAAEGILTRTSSDDLIIVGFSERNEFERWMFGDVARTILNQAQGPVIMVSRALREDTAASRWGRRFLGWISPTLTKVEQEDIVRQAQTMTAINIDYAMLILVSATLAALGLLLNSSAVIIGAMLVAPLMQPLIGLSTGLVVGRVYLARRALVTLVVGFVASIAVAYVLGTVLPVVLPTDEMNARRNPTLLDAAVALASGVIGAYATARRDIPAALAGVAIAAALMPPICTIGLGLALGDNALAFGATVLFLTNIICIISAGVLVFAWLGMWIQPLDDIAATSQYAALLLLLLVALPVGYELFQLTQQSNTTSIIRQEIQAAIEPEGQLVEITSPARDDSTIIATVRTSEDLTAADVAGIEQRVANRLGEVIHLELVVQEVIRLSVQPADPEAEDNAAQPAPNPDMEATAELTPEPES